ncbi:hypothetical protein [Sanguibacter suaedae]|uniref:HK97 gp10 family phage protein n=1 Tax=Sanguibacter suaedae TaxID=2795737 RepID=A0A934I316_9MICO|nr:hypothetical protein [Sanguibacter suaedae]MBI9114303.1 hypothetical protein [Sanguibacter suaedae]
MVDLGPVLNLGGTLAASAVRTFGTEVTPAVEIFGETDPVTLERPVAVQALGKQQGIIIKTGGATGELIPGVQVQVTDWRVVLLPNVPDVATVSTNLPQARRLEFGFFGEDSLGRNYRQPPYPHWRPAIAGVADVFATELDRATRASRRTS